MANAPPGRVRKTAADRHGAEAPQVKERLAELRDLPVEHRNHVGASKQHVAVVIVAVDERRRAFDRNLYREQATELGGAHGQLFGGPLHEHRPTHHLLAKADGLFVADARLLDLERLHPLQNIDRGGGDVSRLLTLRRLFDACAVDSLHEDERAPVDAWV